MLPTNSAPEPSRTIAILFGASRWERHPGLDSKEFAPAYHKAALRVRRYLTAVDGLGLPKSNVLDLFGSRRSHVDQDELIRKFVRNLSAACNDILVYFIGHGTSNRDGRFVFMLRSTERDRLTQTAYGTRDLADALRDAAPLQRRWVILDCCASGKAFPDFQASRSPSDILKSETDEVLPGSGTALFTACSSDGVARADKELGSTIFTAALLDVLESGHGMLQRKLNLLQVATLTRANINLRLGPEGVRPEVSNPDQRQGELSQVPFFPNFAKDKFLDRSIRTVGTIARPTTVYFATNRYVTDAYDQVRSYGATMAPPVHSSLITYGTAFVDVNGIIMQLIDVNRGAFSVQAIGDLIAPGRDLLIFIHGFDSTFSDTFAWAASNREWLAASMEPGTGPAVLAFSWASKGHEAASPILQADYLSDRLIARHTGAHLMFLLANLSPILVEARANGRRATLLVHGLGCLALESALESWFLHGNLGNMMFDLAILAAADVDYDTFSQPEFAGLSGLTLLAKRVLICYSRDDQVLNMAANRGSKRLGQDGPFDHTDSAAFPPFQYQMVDCTDYLDYNRDFLASHEYYRLSLTVRSIIAAAMASTPVA